MTAYTGETQRLVVQEPQVRLAEQFRSMWVSGMEVGDTGYLLNKSDFYATNGWLCCLSESATVLPLIFAPTEDYILVWRAPYGYVVTLVDVVNMNFIRSVRGETIPVARLFVQKDGKYVYDSSADELDQSAF